MQKVKEHDWYETTWYSINVTYQRQISEIPIMYFRADDVTLTRAKSTNDRRLKVAKSKFKQELRITMNVILVTSVFLVLTLPLCIRLIVYKFVDPTASVQAFATFFLVFNIAQKVFYINSAVNFYIYMMMGHRFRVDLRKLFTGK